MRLELRFEFNEFGETCSHVWPEEPPKPVETVRWFQGQPFSFSVKNKVMFWCPLLGKRKTDPFTASRLTLTLTPPGTRPGAASFRVWPPRAAYLFGRSAPSLQTFSPNRVYYNALLLQQLARPYASCLQEASATVHWVHPWKRWGRKEEDERPATG